MARLEDRFRLDDATIHLMMPHWECFSSTGLKIHKWLTTNREPANSLWRANLLKIVQLSMVPHCPTCRCQRTAPLPSRPLDLEDVRTLRVVKLNPKPCPQRWAPYYLCHNHVQPCARVYCPGTTPSAQNPQEGHSCVQLLSFQ